MDSAVNTADVDFEHSQILAERGTLDADRAQIAADRESFERERETASRAIAEYEARQQRLLEELETLRAQAQCAQVAASTVDVENLEDERSRLSVERRTLEAEHARVVEEWKAIEAERDTLLREREVFASELAELESRRQQQHVDAEVTVSSPESVAAPESEPSQPFEAQSASDIIARLSASGMWKDDVPEEESVAETATPEPAWKSLVPTPEQAPAPKPAAAAEEEDSIESYMTRLLQRVSGDSEAAPRWTPPADPDAPPSAPVAAASVSAPPTVEAEAFDPKTYVPRSTAPELNANLAAMRALANSTARDAIDTSSKRVQLRAAATKLSLSMIAVLTNFALWWLALRSEGLLPFFASVMASLCSGAWFLSAAAKWHRARKLQKKPLATEEASRDD
jgi:hypothetical protein